MAIKATTKPPATRATRCLRNLLQNSLQGARTAAAACAGGRSADVSRSSFIADERVDRAVDDVHGEGDEDELEREEEDLRLDHRVVVHVHGVHEETAHAGPVEDLLDDDGAAEQEAELESHHRDHGDERVAQPVL